MSEIERDEVARFEAEQDIVLDVQFMLLDLIAERGLTRAQAAKLAGISSARFSQLMRADANPTLRTLAGLFLALGDGMCVERKSKRRQISKAGEWGSLDDRAVALPSAKPLNRDMTRLVSALRRPSPGLNDNLAIPDLELQAA